MNKIKKIEILQTVKVRKYPVNTDKLKEVLRTHKNCTNKEIAMKLGKPLTLVEHWFRKDDCFSIPDPDIWFELKKILGIKTNEFDKSITEFEERAGKYEKANRVYFDDGISPTLTSHSKHEKIIVGSTQKNASIRKDGVTPTLTSSMGLGGGHIPMHNYDFRIRKLTPKECWRLMGFSDEDFEKAEKVNSNTQLYKQAGNSICIQVLMAIFKQLF